MSNVQNRPVDESHVKALAAVFTKIRRCQPQDQLDLAMTPEQFEHCLAYTVSIMQAKKVDLPQYRDVAALRDAVDPNKLHIKYETMPVLCWDPKLRPLPSLKTGQHRRLALMRKNNIPDIYEAGQEIDENNKTVSDLLIFLIGRSIVDLRRPAIWLGNLHRRLHKIRCEIFHCRMLE